MEQDPTEVALHTHRTFGRRPVQEFEGVSEVLPISWVEARGSPTAVRLERAPVATGTGEEYRGRGREGVVDNTGAPEGVAEVL